MSMKILVRSYLTKHSEEDYDNGGRNKELSAANAMRKSKGQGKWNCTSESTVGQSKLIFEVKCYDSETVNNLSQKQDTWEGVIEDNEVVLLVENQSKNIWLVPLILHHGQQGGGKNNKTHPLLTQTSPYEGKQQCEQDVTPVPLVFCCYSDNAEKKEDEGLWDGAKHFDRVADGCAGTLGNIFLHIVFHSDGADHNAAKKTLSPFLFCLILTALKMFGL